MSSKPNVIFHNIDTTEKKLNFHGYPQRKNHNLEFVASPNIKFCKNVANRQKVKVTNFKVTTVVVMEKIKKVEVGRGGRNGLGLMVQS